MATGIEPEPGFAGEERPGGVTGTQVSRPELSERLGGPARVTVVSASAGSGKTMLLQSWLARAELAGRAAWVPVGRGEREPQRFWMSVTSALRTTASGAGLVRAVSAAPDLDAWGLAERLLKDLAPLEDVLWLVVDDVHELDAEALRQLELLVMRAPRELRFVLAARHDVRLGLHRLRLEGELAEIRESDLRFSLAEAGDLFAAAGVDLPQAAVAVLHERTEGWAAGLRMAALSLAGHPDPEGFAAEFSGSERTVAEYLLAEVLERQSQQVRRLLLRTSILERVNGELARLLTGDDGGDRVLHDLERANAFVVALDASRTWFRYHQLFAGLLQLELRHTAPGEVTGLHRASAEWFAAHGFPVEAIRHAQAARDWGLAARLLADQWSGLHLDGQAVTVHELLSGFPGDLVSADAGLAVVAAADELAQGSVETADRYLDLAGRALTSVPGARRGQLRFLHGIISLLLAHQRVNLPAVTGQAARLIAMAEDEDEDTARPAFTEDLRALGLISFGSTLFWATGEDTRRKLEHGLALARRIGRPYLEFTGLAWQSAGDVYKSLRRASEGAMAAVELARRHGWSNQPAFGVACMVVGVVLLWQGQLDEADAWARRAERVVRAETHPAPAMSIRNLRCVLELARGQDAEALAVLQTADSLAAERLVSPQHHAPRAPALMVHALARLGEIERAERVLGGLVQEDRAHAEVRIAAAVLRLAQGDPQAALAELAPVLDRAAPAYWLVMAHILDAAARDALGDAAAADSALERALDLAEPDGVVTPFLLYAAPGLLERHAQRGTAHASLLGQIRVLLAGGQPRLASPARPRPLLEAPSESELRVLRYLPTHLSAPEIARELYVSRNTVRTHIRNLYIKLGTHGRAEAVERARALGLLAPSGSGRANGITQM